MAETPTPTLAFADGCPDCGSRDVNLPPPLPATGDDFDWLLRDYDGFRTFMMEELAARFSERRRWTAADMEVVLVETLSVALDQLSDMLDRVAGEAFLATARRPQSVRRLLQMIGYDALAIAAARQTAGGSGGSEDYDAAWLERQWLQYPHLMEAAREAGPRAIHTQRRMVTTSDYAERLEDHPLVTRAVAWTEWSGSWPLMNVAVRNVEDLGLDLSLADGTLEAAARQALEAEVAAFHLERGLALPDLASTPTLRVILRPYVDAYRMAGQEVCLRDGEPVGINLAIGIRIAANYFQSELRSAAKEALGTGVGGFFESGRLAFGEDLHASDLFETLMALDGVEAVCLNRFKRVGKGFPNEADRGTIQLEGLEYAVCDHDRQHPERGYLDIKIHGGKKG